MGNSMIKSRFERFKNHQKPTYKTTIMDLPEELWLEIFKKLETSDIRKSIAYVCRAWHRVAQDSSLYSFIILDYRLKDESIYIVKRYREYINYIDLRHESNLDWLLENIMLCENLKLLRLDYCRQCIDLKMSVIKAIFNNCKYLSRFEIMYEIKPSGRVSAHKIAIITVIFFRVPPFSKFIMTIYTKKGWKKNKRCMSAIVRFEKTAFAEVLYSMNIKEFIRIIAQETFGLREK